MSVVNGISEFNVPIVVTKGENMNFVDILNVERTLPNTEMRDYRRGAVTRGSAIGYLGDVGYCNYANEGENASRLAPIIEEGNMRGIYNLSKRIVDNNRAEAAVSSVRHTLLRNYDLDPVITQRWLAVWVREITLSPDERSFMPSAGKAEASFGDIMASFLRDGTTAYMEDPMRYHRLRRYKRQQSGRPPKSQRHTTLGSAKLALLKQQSGLHLIHDPLTSPDIS